MRDGGCWPPTADSTGLGLRRGGKELAGRMRGGGGWLRVGRGCTKRACCCRGGGCRCNAGAAGRLGRSRGGGWFSVAVGAEGVGVDGVRGACASRACRGGSQKTRHEAASMDRVSAGLWSGLPRGRGNQPTQNRNGNTSVFGKRGLLFILKENQSQKSKPEKATELRNRHLYRRTASGNAGRSSSEQGQVHTGPARQGVPALSAPGSSSGQPHTPTHLLFFIRAPPWRHRARASGLFP